MRVANPQKQHISAIILAAGTSKRFGQPKQLLIWKGKPLVRHVTEAALQSGISEVKIIVGEDNELITQVLKDLPVIIVKNYQWQEGQSTSVKAGVVSLDQQCRAAIFLLADQPNVKPELISILIASHKHTQAPIIAPRFNGHPGNPVLFDQITFPDLQNITGDAGGRQIFHNYPVLYIDWNDQSTFLDIDTEEDYIKLRKLE